MEGVKTESQDDSSWLEDSQAPGQLGNPLQREQTVPAALHYKVSSGPTGQTSRDATQLDKGWEEAEGLRGGGGGGGSHPGVGGGEGASPVWLLLPVLAPNLPHQRVSKDGKRPPPKNTQRQPLSAQT